jgi:hypothetical protein
MARNLERELARLSRTVRRKVAFRQPREAQSANPINLTALDRIALAWDRARSRILRWFRRF